MSSVFLKGSKGISLRSFAFPAVRFFGISPSLFSSPVSRFPFFPRTFASAAAARSSPSSGALIRKAKKAELSAKSAVKRAVSKAKTAATKAKERRIAAVKREKERARRRRDSEKVKSQMRRVSLRERERKVRLRAKEKQKEFSLNHKVEQRIKSLRPPRVGSPFVLFSQSFRSRLSSEEKRNVVSAAKRCGEEWNKMSDKDKQVYVDEFKKLKSEHDKSMRSYELKFPRRPLLPPSPYRLYVAQRFPALKATNPQMKANDVFKAIAGEWSNLKKKGPSSEFQTLTSQAKSEQEKYKRDLEAWQRKQKEIIEKEKNNIVREIENKEKSGKGKEK